MLPTNISRISHRREPSRKSPLRDEFYLTGGTVLAAFYLHHRYSVDLDLFTENPVAVAQVPPAMQEIADRLGLRITFTRTLGTFLETFVTSPDGERVEFDSARDSPYRLEPTHLDPELDLWVDNPKDIACNKLSALFDRAEPKDFVDVFFVVQEILPFDRLVVLARRKHVGLDDYWLAMALAQVEQIAVLPRMVKPVSVNELKAFFLARAKELMEQAGAAPEQSCGENLRPRRVTTRHLVRECDCGKRTPLQLQDRLSDLSVQLSEKQRTLRRTL